MDTVNNIAKAAANAVWGENTQTGGTTTATTGSEPVSGQRGNTSAGEPYDKGNLEEPNSTTSTTGLSSVGDSTGQGVGNTSVGGFASGIPDRSTTHGVPGTTEGAYSSGSTSGGIPTSDHYTSGSTSSGVPGSRATTVTGEPHPLSGHHSSTAGTTGGYSSGTTEGSRGPHDSRVANAADPRVDSDRDGSRTVGNTGSTTTGTTGGYSSGTTGGYSSGTTEGSRGPHDSKVANAADPRVDSDRDGSRTVGNTGSTTTGTTGGYSSGTIGGYSSGTTEGSRGPHDSKVANAADPRVDSDRDGSRTVGNTGNNDSRSGHNDSAQFAKTTGTAAESDNVPDNKYTERKAQDTPADTSKGQNDTRDPSDPQTNPKNNPTDVDDTTSGPNKGQELGPGPKSLTEVAKEHGGDAGNTGATTSTGDKSKDKEAETDDPNDPHAASHGEGTGEKYIKSSGLAADGGDFDATNAGAGREADRLLEEKGIHRDPGQPPQATGGDESTEKKSFGQKIKEKLHRN